MFFKHTGPLTISYHLFRSLVGEYSVSEIQYFVKREMKMMKTQTF